MRCRIGLLPFTFDPGGTFGPLTCTFLWDTKHQPTPLLPAATPHTARGLVNTPNKQAAQLAVHVFLLVGLLLEANRCWRTKHGPHKWFTHSYTATLPSQWAAQTLGQNLLLSLTRHLHTARSASIEPNKSARKTTCLHSAAITPSITRPTLPSPAAHYFRSPLVRTLAVGR
jgi:hypothetical protein